MDHIVLIILFLFVSIFYEAPLKNSGKYIFRIILFLFMSIYYEAPLKNSAKYIFKIKRFYFLVEGPVIFLVKMYGHMS